MNAATRIYMVLALLAAFVYARVALTDLDRHGPTTAVLVRAVLVAVFLGYAAVQGLRGAQAWRRRRVRVGGAARAVSAAMMRTGR